MFWMKNPHMLVSMFSSPSLVESGGENTLEVPVNDPDLGHCFERE